MISGKNILMVAGEPSGDLHGAGVIRELKNLNPDVHVLGIGGERMLAMGQEQLFSTKQMAMIGFTEVVRHLPFFYHVLHQLEKSIRQRKPAIAILIDYPGFNLRLAKKLKKYHIPILYYIAPQVWAWGAGRVDKMARLIDQMAVVFAFEVPLFQKAGLETTFVGHPLLEVLRPEYSLATFQAKISVSSSAKILGLLPGSRKQEVERLLPDMLKTGQLLQKKIPDLKIIIAQSSDLSSDIYRDILMRHPTPDAHLIAGATYSVMKYSTCCLVASGTATLETACFATPFVIVYRVSWLTYQMGRRLVKLDRIGLANIVAGEQAVPEFVQDQFVPAKVAEAMLPILQNREIAGEMKKKLRLVRQKLGMEGASKRVAKIAMGLEWQSQS